ncbi:MAG TPA: hypothetical protein VLC94_04710 [Candidatus Acidoferrum sp.]|nr:hypothetical protein [Candidatus Acidoferrum sp.]
MNITCNDRERIFVDGTPEEWAAMESHTATCAGCRQELDSWKSLSVSGGDLHQEWDSPNLWPRIERALAGQAASSRSSGWRGFFGGWKLATLPWQTATAALLLIALTASALWFISRPTHQRIENEALLKNDSVRNVERAQAAYEQAIDKLDAQARSQLASTSTPLMASYREKLQVLDSAIADLKSQAGMNPANGHLRRQLLAMYQEKQDTLEQVLEAKQ